MQGEELRVFVLLQTQAILCFSHINTSKCHLQNFFVVLGDHLSLDHVSIVNYSIFLS